MAHLRAILLSGTLFIAAWSALAGLLTAGSILLGDSATLTGQGLVNVQFVIGPLLGGFFAVFVTGSLAKKQSKTQVCTSFVEAVIAFSVCVAAPWYLIQGAIGYNSTGALKAVTVGAILGIIGGIGACSLLSRRKPLPSVLSPQRHLPSGKSN